MLGIIIGVGAVVLIMSLGAGAQSLILGELDSFGSDLVVILPGASNEKGPPASVFGVKVTSLKLTDMNALKDKKIFPIIFWRLLIMILMLLYIGKRILWIHKLTALVVII